MKRIFCAVCVSLIGLQVLAGEIDDSLQKLDAALQKSAKEQPKSPNDADPRRANLSVMLLPRLRECIEGKDINSAREMLQQLSAYPLSPEALKATEELLIALRKDQEAQEKIAVENIDKAIKHASEAVKSAKTAADLDAILVELGSIKSRPENRRYSDRMQTDRNKLESAYRFVIRWQDYLSGLAEGNTANYRTILRELANSETLLLPRSEILARIEEPGVGERAYRRSLPPAQEIADELVAKTKNLDGVGDLLKQLRRLYQQRWFYSTDRDSDQLTTYILLLESIDLRYQDFKAGFVKNIELAATAAEMPASLVPLKNQLLLLLIPRFIYAPEDTKPKKGEGVVDFLNRVVMEAKSRGDIQLSSRAQEALRQIQHTSSSFYNDTTTVTKFKAAQNQEIAGQYMLAVVSYQEALKTGSEAIPPKRIGERLAEIKKNHPEDFEKGMERFLSLQLLLQNPILRYAIETSGRQEPKSTPTPRLQKDVTPPATPTPTMAPSPTPQPSPAK